MGFRAMVIRATGRLASGVAGHNALPDGEPVPPDTIDPPLPAYLPEPYDDKVIVAIKRPDVAEWSVTAYDVEFGHRQCVAAGARAEVMKPLAIDLFCGLGGWTDGLLAEGYDVVGFDIERHVYGEHAYPAQLVLQDVTTLDGAQFRDAALIVASPPCQAYSYRAMPWSRAKALPPPDNTLFNVCFRIQREASEAAGKRIPLVVENVRGAQKWVGRARWNFGSFFGGDVPALMPMTLKAEQ